MRKHQPKRIQRKYVTLCTIINLDGDIVYTITVWQLDLQHGEDLGLALRVCVIADAAHRLRPANCGK